MRELDQPSSGSKALHAPEQGGGGEVVLVSPADHAQHAKVCAEEQRVGEHADRNT